jgi:hypothetical protein
MRAFSANSASYFRGKSVGLVGSLILCGTVALTAPAYAYTFNTDSDFKLSWDNTLQYSLGVRTGSQDQDILDSVNEDDGDRAFARGHVMENRVDWLSELEGSMDNWGFRTSFAGWYDNVYHEPSANNSPSTFNAFSVAHNNFTHDTVHTAGDNIWLEDLFVYDHLNVASLPVTIRFGRLTETWGESLFAADNGIAYGMAPIDAAKAASVPGLQAKQLFMPVGQVTIGTQINDEISFEAFYHFEWRPTNIPAAGSYFGTSDLVPVGGEQLIVPPGSIYPGSEQAYIVRTNDRNPTGGQFGISMHYAPDNTNWDFGAYALMYNDSEPYLATTGTGANFPAGNKLGEYFWGYQKQIQLYGVSASTTYGPVNIAGEVSARVNNDLQSLNVGTAPGDVATLPAIGNSLHYQTSFVYIGGATPLYQSVTWVGEIMGSHVMQVTSNAAALDTHRERTTLGLRTQFDPQYFQLLPGLDVDLPITLGYNFMGNSMTTNVFNVTGLNHGADLTIGVHGVYHNVWQGSVNFTQYFGRQDDGTNPLGAVAAVPVDRDFVIASVQRSF